MEEAHRPSDQQLVLLANFAVWRHSVQVIADTCNPQKQVNMLDQDTYAKFVNLFNVGEYYGIFNKTRMQCTDSGCVSSESSQRTFWIDLDPHQHALAQTVGYDQSSWDDPDARFKPLPTNLRS